MKLIEVEAPENIQEKNFINSEIGYLYGFLENSEEALKYLAFKKQEIILVQILSEEEINPEFSNEITFIDSETNEAVKMSLTPNVIKEYKKALKVYKKSLEDLVKKYGGKFISVSSSMEIEEIILGEFSKKRVLY